MLSGGAGFNNAVSTVNSALRIRETNEQLENQRTALTRTSFGCGAGKVVLAMFVWIRPLCIFLHRTLNAIQFSVFGAKTPKSASSDLGYNKSILLLLQLFNQKTISNLI